MFHGIEALSKDGEGFVYWRGRQIEHYSFDSVEEEQEAAKKLAAVCNHLESIGVEVSITTAVFFHDWFADMEANHPYKDLLQHLCCYEIVLYKPTNKIALIGARGLAPTTVLYFDGHLWHRVMHAKYGGSADLNETWGYHRVEKEGWQKLPLGSTMIDIPRESYVTWLKDHNIFPNFFDENEGGPWCKDRCCWICTRENWTLQPGEPYPPLLTSYGLTTR